MSQDPLDTRVTNGRFIDPDGPARTSLTIHNGVVVVDDDREVWRNVNASGHLVFPGMIQESALDSDSILTGVRGGTTTAVNKDPDLSGAYTDVLSHTPGSIKVITVPSSGVLSDVEWEALSGDPAVHVQMARDSAVPVIHFLFHIGHREHGLSLERIVDLTSRNIAVAAGLHPAKGSFELGSDGDLFVFDPDGEDPYSDHPWPGRVIFSLQRGRILLFNGQIHTSPGDGQLLG